MKKKNFNNLNLDIYEEELENGLKIFICPMNRYKIDARMTVNFGANVLEFEKNGEMIKVPAGIAHFLEHKMFGKADGTDIMTAYEKNGALGNAYTDDHVTVYHFNSPVNFYDNLLLLLRCVNEPYFTDENVAKEIGVIDQELKATLSEPDAIAYYAAKYNSYKTLPYKYPVIGTKESIKKITKESLYDVYNAFYTPNNMHLVVTGNVKPLEVVSFVKKYYEGLPKKNKPVVKKYNEPKEVQKEKEIINKDINNKVCFINYKVDLSDFDISNFELQRYLNVLLLNKFSSLSGFNDIALKDKNISSPVFWMLDIEAHFANFGFQAEIKTEDALLNLIEKQLSDLSITEEKLKLIKRSWLNGYITNTDMVIPTSEIINGQIIKYGYVVYDALECIKALNVKKAMEIFDKLDFSNKSLVIVQKEC